MTWKKHILFAFTALCCGVFLGAITSILATPILWKLEPILHIELAGHSGPSDWVIVVFIAVWVVVIELVLLWMRQGGKSSTDH